MVWKVEKTDAYVLLSALLAEARGVEPLPEMARTEKGKPYFSDRPDLHFSLSRSGEWSLCALGDGPIGVDIEVVRPRGGKLPRHVLSEGEYGWYQDRGGRWEDFYTLWTMKEARVKCTGEGIFCRPVREISVPLLVPGESMDWEGFLFTALAGEDWRGAVCQERES